MGLRRPAQPGDIRPIVPGAAAREEMRAELSAVVPPRHEPADFPPGGPLEQVIPGLEPALEEAREEWESAEEFEAMFDIGDEEPGTGYGADIERDPQAVLGRIMVNLAQTSRRKQLTLQTALDKAGKGGVARLTGPEGEKKLQFKMPDGEWMDFNPQDRNSIQIFADNAGPMLEAGVIGVAEAGALAVLTGVFGPTVWGAAPIITGGVEAAIAGVAGFLGPTAREAALRAYGVPEEYSRAYEEATFSALMQGGMPAAAKIGWGITKRGTGIAVNALSRLVKGRHGQMMEQLATARNNFQRLGWESAYREKPQQRMAISKDIQARAKAIQKEFGTKAGADFIIAEEAKIVEKWLPAEMGPRITDFLGRAHKVMNTRISGLKNVAAFRFGDKRVSVVKTLESLKKILARSGYDFRDNYMIKTGPRTLKEMPVPGAELIPGEKVAVSMAEVGEEAWQQLAADLPVAAPREVAKRAGNQLVELYNRLSKAHVAEGGLTLPQVYKELEAINNVADYGVEYLVEGVSRRHKASKELFREVRAALASNRNEGMRDALSGSVEAEIFEDTLSEFSHKVDTIKQLKELFDPNTVDPERAARMLMSPMNKQDVKTFNTAMETGFFDRFKSPVDLEQIRLFKQVMGEHSEIYRNTQAGYIVDMLERNSDPGTLIPNAKAILTELRDRKSSVIELLGEDTYKMMQGYARTILGVDVGDALRSGSLRKKLSDTLAYVVVRHPFPSTRARTIMRICQMNPDWMHFLAGGGLEEMAKGFKNPRDKLKFVDVIPKLAQWMSITKTVKTKTGKYVLRFSPRITRILADPVLREHFMRPMMEEQQPEYMRGKPFDFPSLMPEWAKELRVPFQGDPLQQYLGGGGEEEEPEPPLTVPGLEGQ